MYTLNNMLDGAILLDREGAFDSRSLSLTSTTTSCNEKHLNASLSSDSC